jgi:hypothetical protein
VADAAVKEATAAGIVLSDQQCGLLLAASEAQLIKIKENHRKISQAQQTYSEFRRLLPPKQSKQYTSVSFAELETCRIGCMLCAFLVADTKRKGLFGADAGKISSERSLA